MRETTISLPRKLRSSFTLAAKKAFPAETFAYCLGNKIEDTLEIEYLIFPKINLDADGFGFSIPQESTLHAKRIARDSNTKILASLHSHPYPNQPSPPLGAAPSEIDWDYNYPDLPIGICEVYEINSKLRARFRFWPKLPTLKLTT